MQAESSFINYANIKKWHKPLTYGLAAVWFINGFFCKVLNMVPRHQHIVSVILGHTYSGLWTFCIGLFEIGMAIWILSNMKPKLNALVQISIIAIMNFLEFFLVPHLLLWGKLNALFAFILIMVIFLWAFRLNKQPLLPAH